MQKKLTVTVDAEVYEGLHKNIGRRKISKFIEELVRPHVVRPDLESAYAEMAKDRQREKEALKWAEEALQAVRKGEVPGKVLIGAGKFYLELSPGLAQTEIRAEEPKLADAAAAVDQPETRRTRELEDRNK